MDSLGEGTWPCPFPVTGNGHGYVPNMVEPLGCHGDEPIRRMMTLLTTNEITGLVVLREGSLRAGNTLM